MDIASYKRVVLKLSGESLAGDQGFGIDLPTVDAIAAEVKKVREHGIDVAVESMTARPRFRTSMYARRLNFFAAGFLRGSES